MGSSASYSVAVAAALLQAVQAGDDTAAGQWPVDGVAASAELRELVNAWALEGERLFHGNPSGVDNTVCSHGARPLAARRFAVLTRWGRLRCPRRSGAVPQVCRPADAVAGHPPPAVPRHQHERARPLHDAHGDAVGTLVGGPLGKSVGEPLLDAMGASRCMAFAPLGPFSPSLARFAGLLAEQAAGLLGAATITPDSESQLAVRAPTTPHPAACWLGNRVR